MAGRQAQNGRWRGFLGLAGVATALICLAQSCTGGGGTAVPSSQATATRVAHEAAAKAVADLSRRLAVAPAAIHVAGIEPHTWPDTSLGLPEPGKAYAQVETRGYIVTLECARQIYTYHVAGDIVRVDPQKSAPVPPNTALQREMGPGSISQRC